MDRSKAALVVGGTGSQGRKVCAHLLAKGFRVLAQTRDEGTARARSLIYQGAELIVCDPMHTGRLVTAMKSVDAVVSIQTAEGYPSSGKDFRAEDEVALGSQIAEAAAAANVGHFLYHSVGGADRATGIRNWEAKHQIENRIRDLRLPATFLRPVSFMENYTGPRLGVQSGCLQTILNSDTPEQLIALDDVGAFAALILSDPARFIGSALEVAGDQLTPLAIAEQLSAAAGRTIPYEHVEIESFAPFKDDRENAHRFEDIRNGARWFNEEGYRADIAACRSMVPGLKTFNQWLQLEGGEQLRHLFEAHPKE